MQPQPGAKGLGVKRLVGQFSEDAELDGAQQRL
jgi:hypothetical protein